MYFPPTLLLAKWVHAHSGQVSTANTIVDRGARRLVWPSVHRPDFIQHCEVYWQPSRKSYPGDVSRPALAIWASHENCRACWGGKYFDWSSVCRATEVMQQGHFSEVIGNSTIDDRTQLTRSDDTIWLAEFVLVVDLSSHRGRDVKLRRRYQERWWRARRHQPWETETVQLRIGRWNCLQKRVLSKRRNLTCIPASPWVNPCMCIAGSHIV